MTTTPTLVTRRMVVSLVISTCFLPSSALADVAAVAATIERLPRTQRLAAYQTAMVRPGVTEADRVALIKGFSRHARRVSPLYGESRFPFDQPRWASILSYGFKADPNEADTAWALCKILINQQDYRSALPVAAAFEKAHAGHHHAVAWHARCRNKLESGRHPGKMPTFPDTYSGELAVMPDTQVQYWSLVSCDAAPSGHIIDGLCDMQVPLDADRNYTIVISRREDRPVNATVENGVAWLEWPPDGEGLDHPQNREDFTMLQMRIMGTNPSWKERPENVTQPGMEGEVMGPYFPRGEYTDKERFEALGSEVSPR